MQKKIIKDGESNAIKLGIIGASIAGLAAAYFFLGPKGKQHRAHTKAWAIKMKGDVVERLEAAREVSESIYEEIVDSVASEYTKGKKAGSEEISELAQDLKKHWKTISNSAHAMKHEVAKVAGRVAKKAGL